MKHSPFFSPAKVLFSSPFLIHLCVCVCVCVHSSASPYKALHTHNFSCGIKILHKTSNNNYDIFNILASVSAVIKPQARTHKYGKS